MLEGGRGGEGSSGVGEAAGGTWGRGGGGAKRRKIRSLLPEGKWFSSGEDSHSSRPVEGVCQAFRRVHAGRVTEFIYPTADVAARASVATPLCRGPVSQPRWE